MARDTETVGLMEPMLPEEGQRVLDDLAFDLVQKASGLAGQLQPSVRSGIGHLVRSMNCYYSNLIEGHNTHPRDIERALAGNFATETEKRELQQEAKAHIDVQRMIDEGADDAFPHVVDRNYLLWLHEAFCSRLPDDFLWAENPDTGARERVIPGEWRQRDVSVGRHVPPRAEALPRFMARLEEAYTPDRLSRPRQVVAIAAAHHRLLWIHPFLEGNGRVARLWAHAWFKRLGIGSSLWSVSRGLARDHRRYKSLLVAADSPRQGDLDGRGSLSLKALHEFCDFFLRACIDQVDFMGRLLEPQGLLERIEAWTETEVQRGHLPRGSFPLLRQALLAGTFERRRVTELTGYKDRKARDVLYRLLEQGLLVSDTPRGPVRLGFPADAAEAWFPRLYPAAME